MFIKFSFLFFFFCFKSIAFARVLTSEQIALHYKLICEKHVKFKAPDGFCDCMAEHYSKQILTDSDFILIQNFYAGTDLESRSMDTVFNFDYDSAVICLKIFNY